MAPKRKCISCGTPNDHAALFCRLCRSQLRAGIAAANPPVPAVPSRSRWSRVPALLIGLALVATVSATALAGRDLLTATHGVPLPSAVPSTPLDPEPTARSGPTAKVEATPSPKPTLPVPANAGRRADRGHPCEASPKRHGNGIAKGHGPPTCAASGPPAPSPGRRGH